MSERKLLRPENAEKQCLKWKQVQPPEISEDQALKAQRVYRACKKSNEKYLCFVYCECQKFKPDASTLFTRHLFREVLKFAC